MKTEWITLNLMPVPEALTILGWSQRRPLVLLRKKTS